MELGQHPDIPGYLRLRHPASSGFYHLQQHVPLFQGIPRTDSSDWRGLQLLYQVPGHDVSARHNGIPRAGRQPDIYRWICFRERVSDLQALQGALLRYVQPPKRALVFPRQFLSSPLPPEPARVPLRSIDRLRRLITTVTKHSQAIKKRIRLFAGFVFYGLSSIEGRLVTFYFSSLRTGIWSFSQRLVIMSRVIASRSNSGRQPHSSRAQVSSRESGHESAMA